MPVDIATEPDTRQAPVLRVPASATQRWDDPFWYRWAIIYQLHVRSFFDSNGDGVGDFRGLTSKLDYIQQLGATAVWLLPFYPSPLKDDGYDVSDYRNVHSSYGTLRDFKTFLREAHHRGLRVIIELVLNHTSDQHPWFQRARNSPAGSRWRNFYVWSDRVDRYRDARVIFKDYESSNWTWDPAAGAYYWHRFYHHQPDLNFDNPEVVKAILQVLDHWLRMGVDGVRLNGVAYLFEREGTDCENLPETHQLLKHLRHHVDSRYRGRALLADANQWPEDAVAYFGNGDECHAAFHFPLMPRLFMAAQMEDRAPIADALQQTPAGPPGSQWVLFLRNHDELTLEMVTEEERTAMYRYYARDQQARVHRGIRRRLAPLMANDRRKIELLNGLLMSLPGTPVVYYGDEIGMGDNIYLGDRAAVRTPMQWCPGRNGGFSEAETQQLFLPAITDPRYHYETVNVRNQSDNPSSLLSWLKRAIAVRKRSSALTGGSLELLHPTNHKLMAFFRRAEETVLVVANLSRHAQAAQIDLSELAGMVPVEMLGQVPLPPIGQLPYMLTLPPHGFLWLALRDAEQLSDKGALRAGHSLRDGPAPAVVELDGPPESIFEKDALGAYRATPA
jgi:maltose alpha-D-glucosyltransferase / alpha-amylase